MLKLVWPEENTHDQDGFSSNNYMWVFACYLITVLTCV